VALMALFPLWFHEQYALIPCLLSVYCLSCCSLISCPLRYHCIYDPAVWQGPTSSCSDCTLVSSYAHKLILARCVYSQTLQTFQVVLSAPIHTTIGTMDARLAQLASVSVQKDKAAGYLSLLNDLLAARWQSSDDILKFVNVVVTQEYVGLVIGRQVISEL
jgi:hypothetical protein